MNDIHILFKQEKNVSKNALCGIPYEPYKLPWGSDEDREYLKTFTPYSKAVEDQNVRHNKIYCKECSALARQVTKQDLYKDLNHLFEEDSNVVFELMDDLRCMQIHGVRDGLNSNEFFQVLRFYVADCCRRGLRWQDISLGLRVDRANAVGSDVYYLVEAWRKQVKEYKERLNAYKDSS